MHKVAGTVDFSRYEPQSFLIPVAALATFVRMH